MPIAGVGHHYNVRAQPPQIGVVQPPAAHHAGRKVFHHHIADGDQLAENLPTLLTRQIQRQGPLAPVQQLVGGGAVPPVLARLVVGKGAVEAAAARDVGAPRPLDFDDLGAQVGQLPAGVRQRKHIGGIQHPYPVQRQPGHSSHLRND